MNQFLLFRFIVSIDLGSPLRRKLNRVESEFRNVYRDKKLNISVGKSKKMRCNISKDQEPLRVRLDGEKLEEVKKFNYVGLNICARGEMEAEVNHKLIEGVNMMGGLGYLCISGYL